MSDTRSKLAVAFVAAALIAGCESAEPTSAPEEPTETTASETTPPESNETTPPPETENPEPDRTARRSFGGRGLDWEGIRVTVGEVREFTPGEYAAEMGDGASAYVAFTITVENTGSEDFDPSMLHETLQSGSSEAEQVFDTENGIDGAPDTVLLPGRSAEYDVAFGVEDPTDLVLELSPSWELEPGVWVGGLG